MIKAGNRVKYIGPIPNDTFNRTRIYNVIYITNRVCNCSDYSVVFREIKGRSFCSKCKVHYEAAYFNPKLFRSIDYINPNIEIL